MAVYLCLKSLLFIPTTTKYAFNFYRKRSFPSEGKGKSASIYFRQWEDNGAAGKV